MARRRQTVSTKDVAALAGVSIGTVSNSLNAPHKVAEKTRRRVLAAIEELGWEPNENARQLRAGRSTSIGMVVMDVANPYFTDLFRGAEEYLFERDYSVNIGNSDQQLTRETMLLEQFRRSRVGGVILAPTGTDLKAAEELRDKDIPVVLVDRTTSGEFCGVGVDDVAGGYIAAKHLAERGHKRIAFIGGPESLSQVHNRLRGTRKALKEIGGIALHVFPTPDLDVQAGINAAYEILELPEDLRPTAAFCANDLIAIGLLQALVSADVRVPEDVAIVGYDDIVFAASAAVPLSSVRQQKEEMGREAARMLIAAIEYLDRGEEMPVETKIFTPSLVVRASSGGE